MKLHPLIEEAVEAHGGAERWRRYNGVASTIETGGQLWTIKKAPLIAGSRRATVHFEPQRTQVTPFGQPGRTMRWTPELIDVTDAEGKVVAERRRPREAIDRRFDAPWDPLNLAYFNGYAMWTYHSVPFVFADPAYEARDIDPVDCDGERLRGVAVHFPEHIHSHSREQSFYFGTDGLLRRHDYQVEIWAETPAAQLLTGYVDVDGLKFPTRRRAYHRLSDGTPDLDRNYVAIDLSDYALF